MRRSVPILAGILCLLAFAAPGALWAQCAMCQTALTNSPEGQRIAGEFNKAILFMMAAPYTVFAGVVGFVFRQRLGRWLPFRFPARDRAAT